LTENLSCDIRYADDTTLIATIFELLKLSDDVTRRTALAAQAFGRLKEVIWKNRNIVFPLKVSLILPIATYASETETSQKRTTGLLTFSR